jgi:hypothetical protein
MVQLAQNRGASRLTDLLAVDHAKLYLYLGGAGFSAIGKRYASMYPAVDPGVRWFSRNLAKFLGETVPYSKNPELAELARLETAMTAAFEAPDAPIYSSEQFAKLDLAGLGDFVVTLHPSVQRMCFATNATSLWAALQCEEVPPRPEMLNQPQELVVWRQGPSPRFRMLGHDEATVLDLAMHGAKLNKLCENLGHPDAAETPSECALAYLRGWIEAEMVSMVSPKAVGRVSAKQA